MCGQIRGSKRSRMSVSTELVVHSHHMMMAKIQIQRKFIAVIEVEADKEEPKHRHTKCQSLSGERLFARLLSIGFDAVALCVGVCVCAAGVSAHQKHHT